MNRDDSLWNALFAAMHVRTYGRDHNYATVSAVARATDAIVADVRYWRVREAHREFNRRNCTQVHQ